MTRDDERALLGLGTDTGLFRPAAPPPLAGPIAAEALGPMGTLIGPMLASLWGTGGDVLGPVFRPGGNFADYLRDQQYLRTIQEAQRAGSGTAQDLIAGLLAGPGATPEQQAAARAQAPIYDFGYQAFAALAPPPLARFAEDVVFGRTGDPRAAAATLAGQARRLIDPFSGRTGLGGAALAGYYEAAAGDFAADPAGFGSLRLRDAFEIDDALRRRGLGPGALGLEDPARRDARVAAAGGLTEAQFAGLDDAEAGRRTAAFDAQRAMRGVKNLAGAVEAMRDIFGDAGRRDAPMEQLVEALENLAGGSLAGRDPAQLENRVRGLRNAAQTAGVGVEGMITLAATAGRDLQALGVSAGGADRITADTLHAVAGVEQAGLLGRLGYNAPSQDRLAVLQERGRVGAAASPRARALAAAARAAELGIHGREIDAVAAAVASGDVSSVAGMRAEAIYDAIEAAQPGASLSLREAAEAGAFDQQIHDQGIGRAVFERAQGAESLERALARTAGRLGNLGDDDRAAVLGVLRDAATAGEIDDEALRRRGAAAGLDEGLINRALLESGALRGDLRKTAGISLEDWVAVYSDPVRAGTERNRREDAARTAMQQALGGLGNETMGQRIHGLLDEGVTDVGELVRRLGGVVPAEEIDASIARIGAGAGAGDAADATILELAAAEAAGLGRGGLDPEAAAGRIRALGRGGRAAATELRKALEDRGVAVEGSIDQTLRSLPDAVRADDAFMTQVAGLRVAMDRGARDREADDEQRRRDDLSRLDRARELGLIDAGQARRVLEDWRDGVDTVGREALDAMVARADADRGGRVPEPGEDKYWREQAGYGDADPASWSAAMRRDLAQLPGRAEAAAGGPGAAAAGAAPSTDGRPSEVRITGGTITVNGLPGRFEGGTLEFGAVGLDDRGG